MNSATIKMLLASAVTLLEPEAKALLDSQLEPFLNKEVADIGSPDWKRIAGFFEQAFVSAGDSELAALAAKLVLQAA